MPRKLILVGGPNGAGKTTFVRAYLKLYPCRYLSADALAEELSPEKPSLARIEAGRAFSRKVRDALTAGESLVIESTLSGRSAQQYLKLAREEQYWIRLLFVFLETEDTCVERVKVRVEKGGHDVPESDIRRRFHRSNENFREIYRSQVDEWHLFYNSSPAFWHVATASTDGCEVLDEALFSAFNRDKPQMKTNKPLPIEVYRSAAELQRIGNRAVHEGQEESRRLGVPNVYSLNGKVYYELPNGEITDKSPFKESPPK